MACIIAIAAGDLECKTRGILIHDHDPSMCRREFVVYGMEGRDGPWCFFEWWSEAQARDRRRLRVRSLLVLVLVLASPQRQTEACAGGRRQSDDAGVTLPAPARRPRDNSAAAASALLCGKRVGWAETPPVNTGTTAPCSLQFTLHRCAPTHLLACTGQGPKGDTRESQR